MQPRPIGIVAGGGGPIGATFVLREIIAECQKKYGSCRSYEFPCMNFYSYPYSEMMLAHTTSSIPARELSGCIQQLKLIGMEIVVIPCFTLSSYLTFRNYGIELIEIGAVTKTYLENNGITNPLVLCSERTRKSGYCNKYFPCQYPNAQIQSEFTALIEEALKGERIDMRPLINKLPDVPIVCAMTTINAQLKAPIQDPRWIDPVQLLAQYIVHRSYEVSTEEVLSDNLCETLLR